MPQAAAQQQAEEDQQQLPQPTQQQPPVQFHCPNTDQTPDADHEPNDIDRHGRAAAAAEGRVPEPGVALAGEEMPPVNLLPEVLREQLDALAEAGSVLFCFKKKT